MDFLQESSGETNLIQTAQQCLAKRNLDALWALGNPEEIVPALPASAFYHLVRIAEHEDRELLVLHASTEQVQCCWDMDSWKQDRFDPDGADEWMAALLELPDEKFLEKVHGLLPDGFGLYLLSRATIYNVKLNPDIPENDSFFTTPDEYFELQPLQDTPDESWRLLVRFIDRWYALDAEGIQKLLIAVPMELPTFLEEDAYSLRNGRIRDEGFWDTFTAREIYRPVDPARVRLDDRATLVDPPRVATVLPAPWREEETDLLGRAIHALEPLQADAVRANFALLCNRLLAADEVDVADDDAAANIVLRARNAVNLALEYFVTHRKLEAHEVLRRLHVSRLFQCGYFLVHQLAQLARELMKSGAVSLSPGTYTLLEGPWLAFFQALLAPHPLLDPALAGKTGLQFPSSLAQVAQAAEWVEEMSLFKGICFEVLAIPAEVLTNEGAARTCRRNPGAITFGDLLRTAAASLALSGKSGVMSLSRAAANRFLAVPGAKEKARAALAGRIGAVLPLAPARIARIVDTHLQPWNDASDPEAVFLIRTRRTPERRTADAAPTDAG